MPPIPTGSGGGLFGAVTHRFQTDAELYANFGGRIHPGVSPPRTALPYVILTHVNSVLDEYLDTLVLQANVRMEIWKATVQASVYAEGYDSARVLGALVNRKLSRQTFTIECVEVILYPDSQQLLLDAKRSEAGEDVWHAVYRYHTLLPEFLPVDTITTT